MHRKLQHFICLIALAALLSPACSTGAQEKSVQADSNAMRYAFAYTPIYQFETDLDGGGKFDVQRHYFRFNASRSIAPQWSLGLGLSYDYENWNFKDTAEIAGADLWNKVHRPGINIPLTHTLSEQWRLGFVPSFEFSGTSGADWDKAFGYGAVVSLSHVFSRNLVLGLGLGVFDRIEEKNAFPFLVVDWKISQHFRLTNPLRAGPAGPAGLELVYSQDEKWAFGIGGAYRSYRFRLDDRSAVADGVAEVEFLLTFLRTTRRFGAGLSLDFSAGALFGGEIAIEDADGKDLGATGYDTALFAAISVMGRF